MKAKKYEKGQALIFIVAAIVGLVAMTGLTVYQVQGIIQSFFGKYGLKYFIARGMPVKVNGLGTFYFHKKTEQRKRKNKT